MEQTRKCTPGYGVGLSKEALLNLVKYQHLDILYFHQ